MLFRFLMITNGFTALVGAAFWSTAFFQSTTAVSAQDQAIGYLLLTVLRGY